MAAVAVADPGPVATVARAPAVGAERSAEGARLRPAAAREAAAAGLPARTRRLRTSTPIGGEGEAFGGGGGGGGYHGGGGGGFPGVRSGLGSGGGGGGSNYVAPIASGVSVFDGTALGANGAVTVTYSPVHVDAAVLRNRGGEGLRRSGLRVDLSVAAVECDDPQLLAAAFSTLGDGYLIPLITDACTDDTHRLLDDFAIVVDPPDRSIGVVAKPVKVSTVVRLPGCRQRGHAGAPCRRLRAAVASSIVAARQIAAIDDALHTTFDRLSSARRAGDAAAVALQQRAAATLSSRLHTAITARAKLSRTVLGLLTSAGRRAGLTRAQDATAIARLLQRLEKAGVPRARLRAVAGKAITPRAVSVSSLL